MREDLSGFLGTPYGFLIFFVCLWCFICFFISILGGWFSLSRRFRAHTMPYGETKSAGPLFYGVKMRLRVSYGNVIRLTVATDALYISILFPFRIGHPPLCIPWSEIQMRRTTFLWLRFAVLTLGEKERIPLRISERMARKLGILEGLPSGNVSAQTTTHPGMIT